MPAHNETITIISSTTLYSTMNQTTTTTTALLVQLQKHCPGSSMQPVPCGLEWWTVMGVAEYWLLRILVGLLVLLLFIAVASLQLQLVTWGLCSEPYNDPVLPEEAQRIPKDQIKCSGKHVHFPDPCGCIIGVCRTPPEDDEGTKENES